MSFRPGAVLDAREFRGRRVIFRFPKASDAPSALRFINALIDERARILLTRKITLADEERWIRATISAGRRGTEFIVLGVSDGDVCAIAGVDRNRATATIGGRRMPSADSHLASYHISVFREFRNAGLATHISMLLFRLAKKDWGTKIIKSSYMSDNTASARLHRKLGFKIIGSIPKAAKYGKKYVDEVICYKNI